MALEQEIDKLYGMPLDEFVEKRDELAKDLRRSGDRAAADAVKSLRKPTVGAWALNQAVRRRRRETDALLAAGEHLRAAHEALLAGGDPAALRDAMQKERSLAGALADCAEALASETGKSGPALKERVRATLHAAAVDDETREQLETGRVVREREAVGLGPLGEAVAAAATLPARRGRPAKREPSAPAKRGGARSAAGKGDAAAPPKRGRARSTAAKDGPSATERRRAERLAAVERSLDEARAALDEAQTARSAATDEVEAARKSLHDAEDAQRAARKLERDRERQVVKRERELARLQPKPR